MNTYWLFDKVYGTGTSTDETYPRDPVLVNADDRFMSDHLHDPTTRKSIQIWACAQVSEKKVCSLFPNQTFVIITLLIEVRRGLWYCPRPKSNIADLGPADFDDKKKYIELQA